MTTMNPNSPEVLQQEILAEAGRACDEIIRRAQSESATLLAAAAVEADKINREKTNSARVEAARRRELMLATIPVETGRLRSARIETVLENIRGEVRRQLLARNFDSREAATALAAEAIRQMPGTDFVLKISADDHARFGDGLEEDVVRRSGRSPLNLRISADPAMTGGGVVVEDADGKRIWDNQLQSRLERFWPELRRQIAVRTSLVGNNEPAGGSA